MRIGVLTFLHVSNYGANLQAASTYYYLKQQGHTPIFINYRSYQTAFTETISLFKRKIQRREILKQSLEHQRFVDKHILFQTKQVHTCKQVYQTIIDNNIDAIIIGSDAVAQHWPLFSTLKLGRHRPFWIEPLQQERRFPNPFWGVGFSEEIPTAMMSVSSQNSKYHRFSRETLKKIGQQLKRMRYISVRDAWTKDMMLSANSDLNIDITPDPVFALNQNLADLLPSEKELRRKYDLPQNYVLVGLRSQVFSFEQLQELDNLMKKENKECVAFNIDGVYAYMHPFKYTIPLPLSPLDWFGLIKYASAYIGSNMHPIVSSLANGTPCFCIDNWGSIDFWGNKENPKNSKVYDVLKQYGLEKFRAEIDKGVCFIPMREIVALLREFPVEKVKEISEERCLKYNKMMGSILRTFEKQ